ncbi:MAG: hypothetical protein PHN84_15970 [Desulfuromonadaceae bacterium]|nr:hypothetical protein [Desulfuromonadaceae bacterium]MDD2857000.1 hypothetical protein [Desulfuromonadaceae bacterium]
MAQLLNTPKELDFLIHETGKDSSVLLAQAVQEGIHILFKRQVAEAYVNHQLDRDKALLLLGSEELEQIDYAWESLEKDISWGMGNA